MQRHLCSSNPSFLAASDDERTAVITRLFDSTNLDVALRATVLQSDALLDGAGSLCILQRHSDGERGPTHICARGVEQLANQPAHEARVRDAAAVERGSDSSVLALAQHRARRHRLPQACQHQLAPCRIVVVRGDLQQPAREPHTSCIIEVVQQLSFQAWGVRGLRLLIKTAK